MGRDGHQSSKLDGGQRPFRTRSDTPVDRLADPLDPSTRRLASHADTDT